MNRKLYGNNPHILKAMLAVHFEDKLQDAE
jgi:hypothetical protein